MRKPLTHYHCRFCGDLPRQALRYSGPVGKFPNLARQYCCGLCNGFITAEKVTKRELRNGEIEDHEFAPCEYYYLHFQSFAHDSGLFDIHEDYMQVEKYAMKNGLTMLEALG